MTDIEKLKNNDLFVKAVEAAREMLPGHNLYTGLVDLVDEQIFLYIEGVSFEDCDRVGEAAFPGYDYIEAGNFRQPIFVDPITASDTRNLIDITNLEV